MSTIANRWEFVEPWLALYGMHDQASFDRGCAEVTDDEAWKSATDTSQFAPEALARARLGEHTPLSSKKEPLAERLCRVARCWLRSNGGHWSLATGRQSDLAAAIHRWRFATLLVPPSILVGAALAQFDGTGPTHVQLLPEPLAPLEECDQLHVHLGPMLPFEALWSELRFTWLRHRTLERVRGKPSDPVPPIGESRDCQMPWARWQWILELAFAARLWLDRESIGVSSNFEARDRLEEAPPGDRVRQLADRANNLPYALSLFAKGKISDDRREIGASRRQLLADPGVSQRLRRAARSEIEARQRDVRAYRRERPGQRESEALRTPERDDTVLVAKELARATMSSKLPAEPHRVQLLLQYLRVKTALYRHLTVNPMKSSLGHFLEVVKRSGPYEGSERANERLDRVRDFAAGRAEPLQLRSTEVHVPPSRVIERKTPAALSEDTRWIIGFVRNGRSHGNTRARSNSPVSMQPRQWAHMRRSVAAQCRAIARRIEARPSLLRTVRAIGLMDWERVGPLWLFASSFERLLERSRRAASAGYSTVKPLQTAFHLGEDYDHLFTGLRVILEPIHWGLVQPGDRIGHAFAMSLDPTQWIKDHPHVSMTPFDRLMDIGFVYWLITEHQVTCAGIEVEHLRSEAATLLQRMFCHPKARFREASAPPSPASFGDSLAFARDLWLSLPRMSRDARSEPSPNTEQIRDCITLLHECTTTERLAFDPSYTVETRGERALLAAAHECVRGKVMAHAIAVDSNPSSNLLIGALPLVFAQPTLHTAQIPVTISTDDPLTFATTLADEYAYAWAGMVREKSCSPQEATARLEQFARASRQFAFRGTTARRAPAR